MLFTMLNMVGSVLLLQNQCQARSLNDETKQPRKETDVANPIDLPVNELINNQSDAEHANNIIKSIDDQEYDLFAKSILPSDNRLVKRQSPMIPTDRINHGGSQVPSNLHNRRKRKAGYWSKDSDDSDHSANQNRGRLQGDSETSSNDESSEEEFNVIVKDGFSSISSSEEAFEERYFDGKNKLFDIATLDFDDYQRNLEHFKLTGRLLTDAEPPPEPEPASLRTLAVIVVGSAIGLIFLGAGGYVAMKYKRSPYVKGDSRSCCFQSTRGERTISGGELLPASPKEKSYFPTALSTGDDLVLKQKDWRIEESSMK